jgi:hypothetical protein
MTDVAMSVREGLRKAGIDVPTLEVVLTSSGEALYVLSSHGSQTIPLWRRLRELVSQTGHWPILVGEEKDLEALREQVQSSDFGTTKEIIDRALAIDPVQWLDQKHEALVDELLEFGGQLYSDSAEESLGNREEFRGLPRGPWPAESSPWHDFQIPIDLVAKKPLPRVNIALVPTTTCWQVPAYLRFGAWNDCPQPEEHVTLMRFWQQCWDAEVVGITRDVVEIRVGNPPSNKVDALKLAKQQYLYCEDIVDQGTRTLESLAAGLLDGTSWFFWWD